jgi:hypothetical protein
MLHALTPLHIPLKLIVHASKFIFSESANNLPELFSSTLLSPDKLSKKEALFAVLRTGHSGIHSTDSTPDFSKLILLYMVLVYQTTTIESIPDVIRERAASSNVQEEVFGNRRSIFLLMFQDSATTPEHHSPVMIGRSSLTPYATN